MSDKNIFLIDKTTIFENHHIFECLIFQNFNISLCWIFLVSQVSQQCLHYFRLVDYSYISKLLSCLDKSTTLRVKTKNDVRTFKRVEFFHSKISIHIIKKPNEICEIGLPPFTNESLCMYLFVNIVSKNTSTENCRLLS